MVQGIPVVEAATAGLMVARQRPRVLVGCALLYLIGQLISLAISVGPAAPIYTQISDLQAVGGQATPERVLQMMQLFGQIGMMTLPSTLIWVSLINAVVYRAMFRPEDGRLFYLGLGPEEGRQIGSLLLQWATLLVASGAISVLLAAVGALGGMSEALVSLGTLVAAGVLIHLWTRLSLAGAATFAEGGVRLSRSWRMTGGQFWRLLGIYILAAMAAFALAQVWTALVSVVTGGVVNDMGEAMGRGGFDIRTYFANNAAALVAAHVLTSPMGGLQMLLITAPSAVLYRHLAAAER